ncbi:MAG: hypothetical protein P4L36_07345 [Holophaga sp.]|nr:hypothetical protein [Holophaga sp.]
MTPEPRSLIRLDWADAAVPVLASIGFVIKQGKPDPVTIVGSGIGYALAVAVLFCGARQIVGARTGPRRPVLAALVGLLVWGFILSR